MEKKMSKYIFVTGGVISGLGKGITAASLGRLLKSRGLKVAAQKLDPYVNVDPGTMSPYQHGEVFVTDDGAETDLDLGHYERFTNVPLDASCSVSSGKVYWNVINRERTGGYLGRTVQIIPDVIDEIKNWIYISEKQNITYEKNMITIMLYVFYCCIVRMIVYRHNWLSSYEIHICYRRCSFRIR